MQSTETCAHSVPLHGRVETDRRRQTTPLASMASRTTPVDALLHGLVSTHAHHAADWSVDASQTYPKRVGKSEALRRPLLSSCTALHASPHCTQACPSIITSHGDSKRANQATKPCSSSLQTAATSGGSTCGAQTVERPHCRPAACWLSPKCTSGLLIDSNDGRELLSCGCEG